MLTIKNQIYEVKVEIPPLKETMEGKLVGGFLGMTGTQDGTGNNKVCNGSTNSSSCMNGACDNSTNDLDCVNQKGNQSINYYCFNTDSCSESKNFTTPAPPSKPYPGENMICM